jgi:NAD(P)H dehydrogenase (quinone)
MILVTGAAGKTGRAVIRAMAAKGEVVRALVHRPEQAGLVQGLGARQALVGDMRLQDAVDQAAQGCQAIYHVCPNMSRDELSIGQVAISAARSAQVKHFVYHSVLHPQTEAMPHHWQKLRVEEQLFESGLSYTILQPTVYMQNLLAHWDLIAHKGVLPLPYAPETRLGMVDLQDVAAAAVRVLTEKGHEGATYELVGTEALSQTEVLAVISRELGRPVRARPISLEEWEGLARRAGLGDYRIETLIKMFRYYERHDFWGSPRVLGWLLGRPPTTLAAFVRRVAHEPSDA